DRMVFRSRRHIPGHRGPSVPTPSDSDSNSKTALLGCTLKTLGGRVTPPSLLRDEIRQRWRRDEPKVVQIQFQSSCRCLTLLRRSCLLFLRVSPAKFNSYNYAHVDFRYRFLAVAH